MTIPHTLPRRPDAVAHRRRAAAALACLLTLAPLAACTAPAPTPSATATATVAPTPAAAPVAQFSLTVADGTFTLAGAATDDAARAAAVAAVSAGLGAGVPVDDQLTVVDGAWLPDADALTALASELVGVEAVSLNVNAGDAVVAGTVTDEAERQAAVDAVTTAFPDAEVTDTIAIVELCTVVGAKVREASQPPALVFETGSTDLTDASQTAVAEIAELVAQCPDTTLTVVGQTDARGSESGNEALALERANVVAAALEAAGVPSQSLLVQGNAANAPVSDDDALNRRVDVAVQ
ncbi:OmpA family protein [Propioniciclava soli]|uniref:OmpA family protein n=1 Tax=Propioniciclava soli TaxID=2775081 RepID=A0ABZ3C5K9_9ACTN